MWGINENPLTPQSPMYRAFEPCREGMWGYFAPKAQSNCVYFRYFLNRLRNKLRRIVWCFRKVFVILQTTTI